MASIKPFKIAISDERIHNLKQKLAISNLPDDLNDDGTPWTLGPPREDMARLISHWKSESKWRDIEAQLNELPQFTTDIEVEGFSSCNVHFVHRRSTVTNAIPLLFLHGWPSSFLEVTKLLAGLVDGGADSPSFHVVAPSLIGFGFSSASKSKDFGIDQHAEAYHKLMLALGYDEYIVQGGDLGYLLSRFLAIKYGPKHCRAHHINNAAPAEPTLEFHPFLHAKVKDTPLTPSELAGLQRSDHFSKEGNGYYRLQSTKPQTLSYALTDSPVALLSWVYEKLHDWTDGYVWTDDEILTWVSIYYFSVSGPGASTLLFYTNEHRSPNAFEAAQEYTDVPLGISRFPRDLILLPRLWNGTLGPVVFEREHQKGGHFPAWEFPELLVGDLRTMFGKGGGAFGCVSGKSGFEDV